MAGTDNKVISPYQGLEDRAFWRSGVAEAGGWPPPDIYRPKFRIPKEMPVFTAGSCFAQHVGRTLKASGYNVIDAEPLAGGVPDEIAHKWGYGLYSGRYGNIYTVRQLRQLLFEAYGEFQPADPVWEKDGQFYDAMRPNVTPGGLATPDLVTDARQDHLAAVRRAVTEAGVVVFTLGLTEAWEHAPSETVYPTAPGTIAGTFDPDVHRFVNFRTTQIRADFELAREVFRAANPDVRFLLTVSPVPLTATAGPQHVLPATIQSKSVLRAVAAELYEDFDDIDYFPSYEIVSSFPAGRLLFEKNMRSVHPRGVRKVMRTFLAAQEGAMSRDEVRAQRKAARADAAAEAQTESAGDVVCEEELLEAFRK